MRRPHRDPGHPTIMGWGNRKSDRVAFSRGLTVQMVAVDGTWHRPCTLLDISSTGARLLLEGSFEGLNLKEFFLQLSSTGTVFRRCELIRVNGNEIGASFRSEAAGKKAAARPPSKVESV